MYNRFAEMRRRYLRCGAAMFIYNDFLIVIVFIIP
mgnify:CR=1 FL=1